MSSTPRRILVLLVLFAGAALGGSVVGRAEQTPAQPDVLSALLIEVRGLRASLELMATAGPRVELALGRVQLQEQRIGSQMRRLDAVREQLVTARNALQPIERETAAYEESVRAGGPDRPPDEHLNFIKAQLGRARAEVNRLTVEEALLTADIANEQNRWADFNQRLEELERALGPR